MSLTLDHIVIAVRDLERTIADYRALGFTVVPGGEHPGRPTHNALVVFADGTYFELIAWRSPSAGERWWELLEHQGEGLVDFALLPPSTAGVVAAAEHRGVAYSGPHDGGRLRPDGVRLEWQTARPPSHDLPFLCGDRTPRALRVPEGDVRTHANGAVGVESLAVAVRDLEATLARYRALLGDDAEHVGQPFTPPGSGVRLATVRLGASTLVLAEPIPGASVPAASSDVVKVLATRGEGPYALVLRTEGSGSTAAPLDTARTHGVHIEFAGR